MIASVSFINLLALVAFALPQKKVVSWASPQLMDDYDFTPDGKICQTAPKGSLSSFNDRYCRCVMNTNFCSGRDYATCEEFCTEHVKNFALGGLGKGFD